MIACRSSQAKVPEHIYLGCSWVIIRCYHYHTEADWHDVDTLKMRLPIIMAGQVPQTHCATEFPVENRTLDQTDCHGKVEIIPDSESNSE